MNNQPQQINLETLTVDQLQQLHTEILSQIGELEIQKQILINNIALIAQVKSKKPTLQMQTINLPKLKKADSSIAGK